MSPNPFIRVKTNEWNHPSRWSACLGLAMVVACMLCLGLISGCSHNMNRPPASAPLRDINAVLADHDKELMAIPGVVGVYVGVLSDERTPCLKVMLARNDPAVKNKLPR